MATNAASLRTDLPPIQVSEPVPPGYSTGKAVPWWAKIGSKLVLARLPIPYALWRGIGIFRYGLAGVHF